MSPASSATSESAKLPSRLRVSARANHTRNLYQFQALGDDDGEQEWTSTDYPNNGDSDAPLPYAFFNPRALQNLLLVETLNSLDPITDAKVVNLLGASSDTPQIYAACGRGSRSTFRTLKHGLDISQLVASPLPGVPNAVWTLKLTDDGAFIASGKFGMKEC